MQRNRAFVFFGGSALFIVGLMIAGSNLMSLLVAIFFAGCYIAIRMMKYICDPPLPKGYNWFIICKKTKRLNKQNNFGGNMRLASIPAVPQYAFTALNKLKDLQRSEKFADLVPAAYILLVDMLTDWFIASGNVEVARSIKNDNFADRSNDTRMLTRLLEQLREQGITLSSDNKIRELEKLYWEHIKSSKQSPSKGLPHHVEKLADDSVKLVEEFLDQEKQKVLNGRY